MFHSETIKLLTEAHVPTPRYGQYLTHADNHITPAEAAMDICLALIGAHQHGIAVGSMSGGKPEYQRTFTAETRAKHSFKWTSVHNLVVSFRYWEGQSVRGKIWERDCAGNQEMHWNKKKQNVYSAFHSLLCEVCLTKKLLAKTTINK